MLIHSTLEKLVNYYACVDAKMATLRDGGLLRSNYCTVKEKRGKLADGGVGRVCHRNVLNTGRDMRHEQVKKLRDKHSLVLKRTRCFLLIMCPDGQNNLYYHHTSPRISASSRQAALWPFHPRFHVLHGT